MGNTESSVVRGAVLGSDMCAALKRRVEELDNLRKSKVTNDNQDRIETIKQEVNRIVYLLEQEKKDALDENGKEELNAWNTDTYNEWKIRRQTEAVHKNPEPVHIAVVHKLEAITQEDRRPIVCARLRPVDDKVKIVGSNSLQHDMGF